jgi:hypothetical protein
MHMPPMLAYTVRPSIFTNNKPYLDIGVGRGTQMAPDKQQEDSYWICIFDAMNPRQKVKDWVLPGSQNSTVPAGIDTYMNNPNYLFAVATQTLSTLHVPQGALFEFFTKYGAGRELQKLEQLNAVLSCGYYGHVSYALTGQCGPREAGKPTPPSYERGEYTGGAALLMMSLMPSMSGAPPGAICDSYTWTNPPAAQA